ncbi:MAG: cell division protein SepF [Clostridium sp.]|nr:cell division protein SepF [Clostridium sp.]MCM1208952.1 cell division protein SepF [Ruminococcus sp.]
MAKEAGKKSFLDFFKMKDLDDDEFDDDLFDDDDDEDDEDDYVPPKPSRKPQNTGNRRTSAEKPQPVSRQSSYSGVSQNPAYKAQTQTAAYNSAKNARPAASSSKLVDFNSGRQQSESYRGRSEVYVIKPQEINEAQTVTDFLRRGKTIVINMEGVELAPAQRIIDFIGGACYALEGTLQAISANIFIAAPNNIEVTGDLREEILNESTVSPELGRY